MGVTKQEVRELLERPEYASRLVRKPGAQIDLASPTRGALVPELLIDELKIAINAAATVSASVESTPPQDSAQSVESPAERVEESSAPPKPEATRGSQPTEMSLAIIYERLLNEKDMRIADLRAEIEHLRAVLDREQQSLARTQALLALQAPRQPEPVEYTDAEFDERDLDDEEAVSEVVSPIEDAESASEEIPEASPATGDVTPVLDIDDDWSEVAVVAPDVSMNGTAGTDSVSAELPSKSSEPTIEMTLPMSHMVEQAPPERTLKFEAQPEPVMASTTPPAVSRWRFWPWFKKR